MSTAKRTFKIRAILYLADHWIVLIAIYITTILMGGFLYSLVETDKTLLQGAYWADTTAMTVGYGDESPKSLAGIWIYFIISKMWIWYLTPIIIGKVISEILVNKNAETDDEQNLKLTYLENLNRAQGLPVYERPHAYMDDDNWELRTIENG